MTYFYGASKKRSYFEGWYFKNQNESEVISLIPAFHIDEKGKKSATLQVIINSSSYQVKYEIDDFSVLKKRLGIRIGNNIFTEEGINLNIATDCVKVEGKLIYSKFLPLRYDIMGPFKFVPFMQCRHSVYSVAHNIKGQLIVNGSLIDFNNGLGYVEGDRGVEFPSSYFWTQCSWRTNRNNTLMLSVADIPIGKLTFMGCIGLVYYGGKEYRMATYLGVKIKKYNNHELWVQQREYDLKVTVIDENPHDLLAPVKGNMTRTVYESLDCRVRYLFMVGGKVIFDFVGRGSFERGI
ncbi:MAG: hypothetical protein EWM47_13945 [Anaerolineaceae bacterium]|nr:MAG: hypothetical protein EWM47_13945 [Anaerolineaceae bacterium]